MNNQRMNKNSFNLEIAEILGAFIGDGWIESDGDALYITGSPSEDKDYYDNHLSRLFSKYFTSVKPKLFDYWGVYGIVTYKKQVINKALTFGFQKGRKCLIAEIPHEVFHSENEEVIKAVLRGIFDTDGSFWCEKSNAKTSIEWKRTHNYIPQIGISSCSKKLLEQILFLLNKLGIYSKIIAKSKQGFKCGRNVHDSYSLGIRRIGDVEKWFQIIGTNNTRHQTRYDVWKKWGYLPSRTTIKERLIILS